MPEGHVGDKVLVWYLVKRLLR